MNLTGQYPRHGTMKHVCSTPSIGSPNTHMPARSFSNTDVDVSPSWSRLKPPGLF
jgi:hypothetical protein